MVGWHGIAEYVSNRIAPFVGNSIPVDVEQLALSIGVSSIERRDMSVEGYIGRTKDRQLVIRVRSGCSPHRARFTVAHELGHLLLAEMRGVELTRMEKRESAEGNAEERLADRIAAEILMPERAVLADLVHQPVCWNSLRHLWWKYRVSCSAMTRRIRELSGVVCVELRVSSNRHPQVFVSTNDLRFCEHPTALANRFLRRGQVSTSSTVKVSIDDATIELPVMIAPLPKGNFEFLVLGWHLLHATDGRVARLY